MAWVSRSLEARCVLFHRQFTDKFIKPWRLRAVYRANGIKQKVVNVRKMPVKANDGRYLPMIETMRLNMQSAVDAKKKIIFLDEIVFTKSSNTRTEWSSRTNNITTPCEALGQKYTAVEAAISKDFGFEHIQMYDEAVNEEKFMLFLKRLAELNHNKKVVIVMDNLAVHKTKDVKSLMRELNFEWIWVVPYSPEYNPIELTFS